jgi:hypothetical protein
MLKTTDSVDKTANQTVLLDLGTKDGVKSMRIGFTDQRLQLTWPLGGLDRFRAGTARLEDFLVPDPQWVRSTAVVHADHWTASAFVPFACLGLAGSAALPALRTAVCRYDRSLGPELLSSTARLTEPNYHRHGEWAELHLAH